MPSPPASSSYPTLARERADRFRSMGALGKPVWQNHVQLRAMLRAKRGETFANYLAKPSYDPDSGELLWTAEVPGAARQFAELSEQEQVKASLALVEIRTGLTSFIGELRAQGGSPAGGTGAFAMLLEQAMKTPAQEFLYFVGRQPVIAFWGFEDQNGRSVDPTFVAPQYTAAPSGTAPAGTGGALPVDAPVIESRRRPWWWWPLWALLALLALLLLLWLLRGCGPDGKLDVARGGAEPPAAAASQADPLRQPGAIAGPGGPIGPGGASADSGTANVPGGAASMPGGDAMPGAAADAPRDANKQDPMKDDPAQKPEPKQDPAKDPANDPKSDPKNDPKSDPKSDPNAQKQDRTTPPNPAVDPKALKVPPDPAQAKKMDFLEGDWKAGEGLADNKTQQPLDLGVKFGKDGKGEITLRRPDGSTCSGPVQGKMNRGQLTVEGNQSIPCSQGGTYAPPKIVCAPDSGGQTPCHGINPDGSKYYMGMRRQ